MFTITILGAQTFQDGPGNETDGDFPSKWDLIEGSARIGTLEGNKVILLSNKTTLTPFLDSKNYLSDTFTLEFEAYFDEVRGSITFQYYTIGFWDGTGHVSFPSNGARASYYPIHVFRHGAEITGTDSDSKYINHKVYLKNMESESGIWRSVYIDYNKGALKVSIDGTQILNIPRYAYKPEMITIGVIAQEHSHNYVHALKNIRLDGINLDSSTDGNDGAGNTTSDDNSNQQTKDYEYAFPIEDGAPNQILQTDGNGTVSWVDDDPAIGTTGNTDDQTIPTDTTSTGTPTLKINNLVDGKSNTHGFSIYLGINSGASDDALYNQNVGLGYETLKNNDSIGQNNVAVGFQALYNNTSGRYNIASGTKALFNNAKGNDNTASGHNALFFNTTGNENTAFGSKALYRNVDGSQNTATGFQALLNNTSGYENTANGYQALYSNTTGEYNVAVGGKALYSNTTGRMNTATGEEALINNTTGNYNTANGTGALFYNTTGIDNTATGYIALMNNTTGNGNIAIGREALYKNTIGGRNTAIGKSVLYNNTIGNKNTAIGHEALFSNTTGHLNSAIGNYALRDNTTGTGNSATGQDALRKNTTGSGNTANGSFALSRNTTGSWNTAIGRGALSRSFRGDNNTAIGSSAEVPDGGASHQVRIGDTRITYAGIQVAWTVTSDKLWKEDIRTLPYGLEFVKQLKPVDYIRKNNKDQTREIGFIAQDIELLLARIGYKDQGFLSEDNEGRMSLRYNDLIPLLTKAIQEQQDIIEAQNTKLEIQDKNYKKLLKRVEQLEQVNNQ